MSPTIDTAWPEAQSKDPQRNSRGYRSGAPIVIKSDLLLINHFSLFIVFLLSIISQFLLYLQAYFIALSFGINVPLVFFFAIVSLSSVITLIPISIQGLGTREAVLLYFFSYFSVDPSSTVLFSVSMVILLDLFVLVFGGYFSLKKKL